MQGSTLADFVSGDNIPYYLRFLSHLAAELISVCFLLMQEVLYCAKRAGVTHILKAGGAQVWLC